MASPHDIVFGGAAAKQRTLTAEQVNLGTKVQKILAELGISKSLAEIAVEAGWMELDRALAIVTGLRKLGVDHPELKPREASDADEAVLDRLSPAARKRLESASRTLASLFYARGAGTLALDQGSPAAAAARPPRKAGDPTPTPVPARRYKHPVLDAVAPPPRKSGALGAILACVAALAAIIGLLMVKKNRTPVPEPEPPPIAAKPPPPPRGPPPPAPKPPPPPAPAADEPDDPTPRDPATDTGVEEKRKLYIEEQEREAARRFEEVKKLLAEGRPASARGMLKRLKEEFGWTEFVKSRTDELARLSKDAEGDSGAPTMTDDPSEPAPEAVAEGPALPAMAAALKRLDDGAASEARRAAAAKKVFAGAKADLALRGGKLVKGAEIIDVSREDLRVRGELDGAKVDLLLAWSALEPASFLSIQKQISKGQGTAGLFELGRACLQRRLWKEAKAAFDECAKLDAAWKPRLPDIGAVLADPAVLRGARRMGDGKILVDYSSADPEQAAEFLPVGGTGATISIAGGSIKISCKQDALWSVKDLAFDGDMDVTFEVEGPGEAIVGFQSDPQQPFPVFHFGAGKPASFDPTRPVTIERRGLSLRARQGDRELLALPDHATSIPRRLLLGATSDVGFRNLRILGKATEESIRSLAALERLEGGAHAGDFRLDPVAMDAEAMSRAAQAEAALHAGQLEDAWTLAEEAVAKSPSGGLAIAIRGLIRLAQGETRLAIADADLALALDPCRGEVVTRARRILSSLRGPAACGAHRRLEMGPWDVRTDGTEERLKFFAGKLDEASKRFAEALKDAGPAPKGIRAAVFASRDAYFAYLEMSGGREAVIVDEPGAEPELIRLAARAYVRAAVAAAPGWFEEGVAAHLAGENRAAEAKSLLAKAPPLEALLRKPAAEVTEFDRILSASVVRFFMAGTYKDLIPDLLKKLRHGVPAMEAFSGKNLQKMDAEWRAWAATDAGK